MMKTEAKIQLAELIIRFFEDQKENKSIPRMIGMLTKAQGIKGFKTAEVDNPVFELGDRYIIYMESIDGKTLVEVPYYKETLKPVIKFNYA